MNRGPSNSRKDFLEIALPEPDEQHQRTIVLSESDVEGAARLLRLITGQESVSDAHEQRVPAVETGSARKWRLLATAERLIRNRQLRCEHFHRAMFSEAAWDILLMLYVSDSAGEPQTQATLSKGLATPPTTIQRWVDYLEKERLVRRDPHPTDRRTSFVSLLEKGREALENYLAEVAE